MSDLHPPPPPASTGSPVGRPAPITLDVGPKISLSIAKLVGSAWLAIGVVAGIAWVVLGMLDPARRSAIWPACGAVALAQAIGLLAMRPWKSRHLGRWPMAWLAGRGVSMASVLILGALLYFPSRSDPLAYGLVAASAYFLSLLAEVAAYAREVKAKTRP